MKNQASLFLKQVFSVVTSILKAKSMAVKSKTSAIKTRLLIFGLLKNKKVLMTNIAHKIHALRGQLKGEESAIGDESKAIVIYNEMSTDAPPDTSCTQLISNGENMAADHYDDDDDDDDDYPDLTHSLFEEEEEDDDDDELDNGSESVIDLVKNSKEDASDFCLEDEIDHVADVFIRRFHRQMKMQKQLSFKRYQEMLNRGV